MSLFLHLFYFDSGSKNHSMKQLINNIFKFQYLLTAVFYLIFTVAIIQSVNFIGVFVLGLEFLDWWPLQGSKLFSLGGIPDSILSTNLSGLSIDILVPGLEESLKTHWLTRTGLSLATIYLFLIVLATYRKMLTTVNINQPFDFANIRRVQLIIALILFEIIGLDYWRTQSMNPVKDLVDKMGSPIVGTDNSYQNADAYAYVLLLLLLTLLSIFRRGMILYQEQRQMEARLFRKKKLEAVGTLASGVGHDFNNILTSIIGYAEIARAETEPKEIHFALERVLDAANRAKRLTQQIRAIGSQNSHAEFEETLDLKHEITELLLSIEPSIPSNVRVINNIDTQMAYEITADSTKIYQVLLNLCTNACQAMELAGGELTIDICEQTYEEKLGYCITIKDEGCGMNKAQLEQIFEPYFTTRHQVGGTGLGLAMCQSIIESYQGFIRVSSTENVGSVFTVWLPKVPV